MPTAAFPYPGLRRRIAAAALLGLSGVAGAQGLPPIQVDNDGAREAGETGPRPRVWIEPRVFVTQGYSSNYLLSATAPQKEWITQAGAGVQAVFNMPRLRGNVDYSLSGIYNAQGVGENGREQTLNSRLLLDAWDNKAFVEFDGAIGNERVSAFAVQAVDPNNPTNQAESRRFRVSPFLRGTWNDAVDYEFRYTVLSAQSDASSRSDLDERGWSTTIGSTEGLGRLGWEVSASSNRVAYSLGRETRFDAMGFLLRYTVTPTLQVFGQVGREANDFLTVDRETYNAHTLGFDWRPVELARVSFSRSQRYFGNGHNLALEYQLRRVLLRYSDVRDVVTSQIAVGDGTGNLGTLLDSLYQAVETDPVRRAQLVQAELQRLGLPADLSTIPGFLTSSASVQRNQAISAVLLGQRSVLSFSIDRVTATQLDPGLTLGDDFDISDEITQKGWTVSYALRLTPVLSFNALYQRRNADGVFANLSNRLNTATVGFTARLARRTTGSVQLRRTNYDGATTYQETAIQAGLVHRF